MLTKLLEGLQVKILDQITRNNLQAIAEISKVEATRPTIRKVENQETGSDSWFLEVKDGEGFVILKIQNAFFCFKS